MKKILIKRILNDGRYNLVDVEKSEVFLDNLQDFVLDVGLVKVGPGCLEYDNKLYDGNTYYTLFTEEEHDGEMVRLKINDFADGAITRYHNKELELLVIFLEKKIRLIFYCSLKKRKLVLDSLEKFCLLK